MDAVGIRAALFGPVPPVVTLFAVVGVLATMETELWSRIGLVIYTVLCLWGWRAWFRRKFRTGGRVRLVLAGRPREDGWVDLDTPFWAEGTVPITRCDGAAVDGWVARCPDRTSEFVGTRLRLHPAPSTTNPMRFEVEIDA